MNIKAIILDIDGTMVSFKTHRMSDNLYNALGQVQEKGIKVIVASGRPACYIDNVRDFPFDAVIGGNGSMTQIDGKLVFSHPLTREDAVAVARIATENRIPTFTFGADSSVEGINCMNDSSRAIQKILNIRVPQVCDLVKLCEENDIYEFTTYVTLPQEKKYYHNSLKNVAYIRWHPTFTDINPKGIDKGVAFAELMDYWGYDVKDSVAFGDGGNDVPMLRTAGIGYAMGGAAQDVIDAADRTTLSVEEDGVIVALKELGILV